MKRLLKEFIRNTLLEEVQFDLKNEKFGNKLREAEVSFEQIIEWFNENPEIKDVYENNAIKNFGKQFSLQNISDLVEKVEIIGYADPEKKELAYVYLDLKREALERLRIYEIDDHPWVGVNCEKNKFLTGGIFKSDALSENSEHFEKMYRSNPAVLSYLRRMDQDDAHNFAKAYDENPEKAGDRRDRVPSEEELFSDNDSAFDDNSVSPVKIFSDKKKVQGKSSLSPGEQRIADDLGFTSKNRKTSTLKKVLDYLIQNQKLDPSIRESLIRKIKRSIQENLSARDLL